MTLAPPRARAGAAVVGGMVLGAALPLLFVGIFFAWPLLTMLGLGFLPEGRLDLAGAAEVLLRPRTVRLLGQTVGLAGAATLLSVAVGVPLAAVLYRLRFAGRGLLRALVILPFVMPSIVVGLAFRALLRESGLLGGLGLDGTPVAIVLAMAFFNIAVVTRTVGTAWESMDPRREQAAQVLGASPATVFRTVTLPRLLPAIGSAAAIVFLFCATAFGIVLVLGGVRIGTLETEIYIQTMQFLDLQAAAVLSVLQLVLVVLLLVLAGRARRSRAAEQRSGVQHAVRRARLRDAPGIALAIAVAGALMLPLVALAERSLRVGESWGLDNYLALAGLGSRNALRISVLEALGNSMLFASIGAVLAVGVGLSASLVLSRTPRSRRARGVLRAADHALMLPLGVSAVTIGLGILIALDTPPFDLRSSPVLLPVAQALVALPLVVRTLLPTLDGIDPRQRDALRVLGARPWQVLRDVDLATVARALLAAAALAFAVCLGEFGATAFLSRPEHATLPVVVYRLIGTPGPGNLGMGFAAAVLLALLTLAIMALVERTRVGTAGTF